MFEALGRELCILKRDAAKGFDRVYVELLGILGCTYNMVNGDLEGETYGGDGQWLFRHGHESLLVLFGGGGDTGIL